MNNTESREKPIWIAHPSHAINIPHYTLLILVVGVILPIYIQQFNPQIMHAWQAGVPLMANVIFYSVLVFPLLAIAWKWLEIRTTRYILTSERLILQWGILNKNTNDLELYRVLDYRLVQPLLLRLFSAGNVVLITSDKSHPVLELKGIKHGGQLYNEIRKQVEICRSTKGVRVFE